MHWLSRRREDRDAANASPPSYAQVTSSSYDDASSLSSSDHGSFMGLQPWLALRARLFLCVFSPALVSIILVGLQMLSASNHADGQASDTKAKLMDACHEAERAASLIASVPHYFADSFNGTTKRAVNDTVHGIGRVLMLAVTAVEKLIVFIVDLYRSFYLCVIELVVRGSLALVTAAVDALGDAVHDVARSLETSIRGSVNGINDGLRHSLGGINDIAKLFHHSIEIPQIQMPDLAALDNVRLPPSFDQGLRDLNASLPTLDELKQKMNEVIELPFEKLKQEISSTIGAYQFEDTALPVPELQSVTFCNATELTKPIDDLSAALHKARGIGIGILVLIALLLMIACIIFEIWRWRSLNKMVDRTWLAIKYGRTPDERQEHSDHEEGAAKAQPGSVARDDIMSVVQIATHPFLAYKGLQCARRLGIKDQDRLVRYRWWLAWIGHPSLVAILVMGIVGFCSAQCQMWALEVGLKKGTHELAEMIQASDEHMRELVNSRLAGISADYANKTNAVILSAEDDINHHVLGWVGVTTSTLNNTLNEFQNGVAEALDKAFGNTPLYTSIQSFIGCIIMDKVELVERGLTWIHDNAQVNFPLVPPDVLLVSQNQTQALTQPAQKEVLGDGSPNSGIVSKLAKTYLDGLTRQRNFFLIVIAFYFLVALIGALIAMCCVGRSRRPRRQVAETLDEEHHDEKDTEGSSESRRHHSISNPMLPEVMTQYYAQQQRQEWEEAQMRDHAARAEGSRAANGRGLTTDHGRSGESGQSYLPYDHARMSSATAMLAATPASERPSAELAPARGLVERSPSSPWLWQQDRFGSLVLDGPSVDTRNASSGHERSRSNVATGASQDAWRSGDVRPPPLSHAPDDVQLTRHT